MATNPPITIGELTNVPAPGSGVQSAWAQSVTNRIVQRFATKAALDAWAASPGSLGVTLDTLRVWERVGTTWVLQLGRCGFGGSQASQSWLSGQTFSMSWPTETFDTDNFGSGGAPLTVPAGLDGLYSISAFVSPAANVNGLSRVDLVIAGGIVASSSIYVGGGFTSVAITREMVAGQNAQVQIVNGHSASMTYSGQVRMLRVSP